MFHQKGHDLVLGVSISLSQAQLFPHTVAPHQIGEGIFEFGDNCPQSGCVWGSFDVQNDLRIDA